MVDSIPSKLQFSLMACRLLLLSNPSAMNCEHMKFEPRPAIALLHCSCTAKPRKSGWSVTSQPVGTKSQGCFHLPEEPRPTCKITEYNYRDNSPCHVMTDQSLEDLKKHLALQADQSEQYILLQALNWFLMRLGLLEINSDLLFPRPSCLQILLNGFQCLGTTLLFQLLLNLDFLGKPKIKGPTTNCTAQVEACSSHFHAIFEFLGLDMISFNVTT